MILAMVQGVFPCTECRNLQHKLGNRTTKCVSSYNMFCVISDRLPSIDLASRSIYNVDCIAVPPKVGAHVHSFAKHGELRHPLQKDRRLLRRNDKLSCPAKHKRLNLDYFCPDKFCAGLVPF